MSKELLKGGEAQETSPLEMHDYSMAGLEGNARALANPQFRKELDRGFDVVLTEAFTASEAGYYLAYRSRAHNVMFSIIQQADQLSDYALGQPHHTALMPFVISPWDTPLTFPQRLFNTMLTCGYQIYRFGVLCSSR